MDVRWFSSSGMETATPADLKALTRRDDGFVWVDLKECQAESLRLLEDCFGFHTLALKACEERSYVPKVHVYPDHLFSIVHSPLAGAPGHVHLIELDQFTGLRYLVTVHGPYSEEVPVADALEDTATLLTRIEAGRFLPSSPGDLSHAITSSVARRHESFVASLADRVANLERRVMSGEAKDPEEMLEEMFRIRHELLTVRTMSAACQEVYSRIATFTKFLPPDQQPLVADIVDRFGRAKGIADGEKEFLQGVVDLYQSRTATKMNIAMERLALITAIVLPVSALASIYGMNIIVSRSTNIGVLTGVLVAMVGVAVGMLIWTKRHGWW